MHSWHSTPFCSFWMLKGEPSALSSNPSKTYCMCVCVRAHTFVRVSEELGGEGEDKERETHVIGMCLIIIPPTLSVFQVLAHKSQSQ